MGKYITLLLKKKFWNLYVFLCCCGFCIVQLVIPFCGFQTQCEASFNWIIDGSLRDNSVLDLGCITSEQMKKYMGSAFSFSAYPNLDKDLINEDTRSSDTGWIIIDLFDFQSKVIVNKTLMDELKT